MENEQLIAASTICHHYQVENQFIKMLCSAGLLEASTSEDEIFIHLSQLSMLEKYQRLHYEMDINIEGIEAIAHLLNRIEQLQQKIHHLQATLHIYKDDKL